MIELTMPAQVLLDPHFRSLSEIFVPAELARLHGLADIVWGKDTPAPEDVITMARQDLEVIIAADWRYGPVENFPRLRAILEVSGKFPDADALDYTACLRRGITVLSCAPAFGPAVAEMALAMTLALGRDLLFGDLLFRKGQEKWFLAGNSATHLLFDQPVGLIGFGGLARALQPLLAPFRCQIHVYDPGMTAAYLQTQGVIPTDLETLLESSKVIYVLAAPTPANRGLLNGDLLRRISPDAMLVLVSRAHLVDFEALTELLCAGRFRAAIDVFPEEPLPADHPIRHAPGTLLSAHRAGGDVHGYRDIGRIVVNDLEAILAGLPPREMQRYLPFSATTAAH
jgi:phosphoglycerate dehydrogenase-like enzyme